MRTTAGFRYSFAKVLKTLLAVIATTAATQAAEVVWTNINGGAWSAVTNWSPNSLPGPADTAYITNAGTYTVTVDVNATLAGFKVGGVSGTQTVSDAAQTLTLNGSGLLDTNGVFNLSGGTLDGTGEFLVRGAFVWSA